MDVERRKYLIREMDFNKLNTPFMRRRRYAYAKPPTWDRMLFEPVEQEWFKKQMTFYLMKGDKVTASAFKHWPYPHELLARTGLPLHDKKYLHWLLRWDDEGHLRIRAGINQPESRMGWVIYERDVKPNLSEELK
jgi:hypothetical protein